jgi:hypothetical protein
MQSKCWFKNGGSWAARRSPATMATSKQRGQQRGQRKYLFQADISSGPFVGRHRFHRQMRMIGINGGHTTYDLGTPSDVVLFFDCINAFVTEKYPGKEWGLLTDRLYRRYLRFDDLERCSELMGLVKISFNEISASSIEWNKSILDGDSKTLLAFRSSNLSGVFYNYFEAFSKAK